MSFKKKYQNEPPLIGLIPNKSWPASFSVLHKRRSGACELSVCRFLEGFRCLQPTAAAIPLQNSEFKHSSGYLESADHHAGHCMPASPTITATRHVLCTENMCRQKAFLSQLNASVIDLQLLN